MDAHMAGSISVKLSGFVKGRWTIQLGPKKIQQIFIQEFFFEEVSFPCNLTLSDLCTHDYTLSALRTVALQHIYLIHYILGDLQCESEIQFCLSPPVLQSSCQETSTIIPEKNSNSFIFHILKGFYDWSILSKVKGVKLLPLAMNNPVGCVNSPLRPEAGSRNLGQTFLYALYSVCIISL